MKFKAYVLCIAILFCFSACGSKSVTPKETKIIPPYTPFTLIDASPVVMSDFSGKTTVVAFWASWCQYSRPVIKDLNNLASRYQGRSDVEILAVSLDKEKDYDQLSAVIKGRGLNNLNHAFSGSEFYDPAYIAFGVTELPTIFIVGPDGAIQAIGDSTAVVKQSLG